MTYPNTQLFIDGTWRAAVSGKTIPVLNPATGLAIGTVAWAEKADLDAALASAEKGFQVWRNTSAYERARLMRRAADLIRQRADAIAEMMTLEQGKPLVQSRMETLAGADIIDWFAGEAQRTYGQIIPSRTPGVLQMTLKLPVGPVAAFTPWNFPINQVV
jgi:succinate-semialdehyde dehydrogenase/glutarate-semialdehyde dehydrogenase